MAREDRTVTIGGFKNLWDAPVAGGFGMDDKLVAEIHRQHEEIAKLRAHIAELETFLEIQRAAQVSAVNQMLAAKQRETDAIEYCAQVADKHARGGSGIAEYIAADIRALKDKP
jgi:hypothetical protein